MQSWLREKLSSNFDGVDFDVLMPPDEKLGDYSTNLAFALGKKEKKPPMEMGIEIVDALKKDPDVSERFELIELAKPGFINFFIKKDFLQKELKTIHARERYGDSIKGNGQRVIIEYSSPNIAKPMHIGHLRSTVIGDALANVYDYLGYDVVRWNYLGDWGTQFGKLIAAYKIWGSEEELNRKPIQYMVDLYIRFHNELKNNPELEKRGQEEFQKLESGDRENRDLWARFKADSLKEFDKTYKQLDVNMSEAVVVGESDYEDEVKSLIKYLSDQGVAKESEGALIIDLEKHGLPPVMLRKSDGATLYLTRDLASLGDRLNKYHPKKILYIVANQQALHFEQLFAAAQELKLASAELVHVKFGMVLGEDGKKLATREGNAIPLQEVIDKITQLARDTVKQKDGLDEKEVESIAHHVGIGALKYNDLKQHPYSDIVFDWKAMLDLTGNSGPYLQYTYARLVNILNKATDREVDVDVKLLEQLEELKLMRQLLNFPDVITKSAELYALNSLALYLYELANSANRFYEAIRVLEDEKIARRDARLVLIETVARVLKKGLELLGIKALERI